MYYENKEVKAFLLLTTSDTAKEMLVLLIVLVKLTLKCYNLYVYWEVGKHITEFFFLFKMLLNSLTKKKTFLFKHRDPFQFINLQTLACNLFYFKEEHKYMFLTNPN